ncbi:ankyrin [Colletotrichum zoysiae]|uniref:Ankyrin n=1 Tax=Colletotrichum zoysiae TaxID=1216348 RepID=A0AAD9LYL1_9PEZI|nr:ankyrin [Colletotrichum zoysiae]
MEPTSSDADEARTADLPVLRPSSRELSNDTNPSAGRSLSGSRTAGPEGAYAASGKRKSTPRKLDSEKCQLCRQHKLKCTPQPRTWPQKCDRCLSKGLECSPGEVKRRARRPAVNQEEPEDAVVTFSNPPAILRHSCEANHGTWDVDDVSMNILTVVQLLSSEYEIHRSQRTVHTRIFEGPGPGGQLRVPYVSSLHLSLPLLKDKLSAAFRTRLGRDALCPAERVVLETALVDLHGDLPRRPTTTTTAGRGGCSSPPKWAQVRDLLFRSRAAPGSEDAGGPLRRLARLAGEMYSEDLMRRFGLHDWAHVEQGFGREWARLLPRSVFGQLLFASGGGEHYREPKCHVKIWAHDVAARNGAGLGLSPRDFASVPAAARGWSLDRHLGFLTAAVGLDERDDQGLSLMHAAVLDRRPDVVRQLLARGARPPRRVRRRRFSLLHFAAAVGCRGCYLELRSHPGLAPAEGEEDEVRDGEGMLPLHVAAMHGHAGVVEAILSSSASRRRDDGGDDGDDDDADYVNRETAGPGWTPLALAIAYPEAGDAAELLARHPGVRFGGVCGDAGQTALHVAAARGKHLLFRALLSAAPGGLINARDDNGETPLHVLARRGDRETIEAALGVPGVDPDPAADDGATPLANAVMEARPGAVEVLAGREGVDVRALRRPLGPFDMSPLDYARQGAERGGVAGGEHVRVLRFLRGCFEGLGETLDECPSLDGWDEEA